jgi:subtilisin family serine protease
VETGNPNVVVAVTDSGTDLNPQDLDNNLWVKPGEMPGNGVDYDRNGFIDDVNGWDFADNDNDPTDPTVACASHGIHTSGTIGAEGNNGTGIAGVNWDVQIMPLRAFRPFLGIFCSGNDANIIAAIEYAAAKGVRVSNNSYGGGPFNQAMFDAIQASNSIFVAAAGNDGTNNDSTPQYPANYALNNIVSVAATDDTDQLASFSNFGANTVDLGAPGVDILSTIGNGLYGLLDGTSMASPHVAGAAALLIAHDSSLTNSEVIWRLTHSVDPTGLPVASGGRLNLASLLSVPPPVVAVTLTANGPTTIPPGSTVSYTVDVVNTAPSAKTAIVQVVAVVPNGREIILENRTITLPAGFSGGQTLSAQVPITAPSGTYQLAARAEVVSESFDEAIVLYTVTP